jgi:CTP synthase
MKHGLKVVPIKLEGYLNYDSGTLNPFRHGEVFVLDDGTECDLDLGTYERMLNTNLTKNSFVTAGRIFKTIIDKERAGKYLGRDVQFIPHVTGEIKNILRTLAKDSDADIVMVEIGGTVGDIENSYFLEAMRELSHEEGKENVCFVNVVYILEPGSLGEQKSKAAQLGLRTLMGIGIQPSIVVCRCEHPVTNNIKEKISIYANVPVSRVLDLYDTKNIYKVPLHLADLGVDDIIFEILGLKKTSRSHADFLDWKELSDKMEKAKNRVLIGIGGKYTNVHDSYMSIIKALEHTAPYYGCNVGIKWIETTNINPKNVKSRLKGIDGLIIPGGFGARGVEGKIECIRYARENNIPFLGLCLGFELATIEFARNVCGLKDANSTEFDPKTKESVICILPEQEEIAGLGGNMRLGGYDMAIKTGTLVSKLYGKKTARERFRHRWNCSTQYLDVLEKNGLVFSGFAPEKRVMQILELPKKDFFVATQFHAEYTSKPLAPNPLFRGFVEAAIKRKEKK